MLLAGLSMSVCIYVYMYMKVLAACLPDMLSSTLPCLRLMERLHT